MDNNNHNNVFQTEYQVFVAATCIILIVFALVLGCDWIGQRKHWYIVKEEGGDEHDMDEYSDDCCSDDDGDDDNGEARKGKGKERASRAVRYTQVFLLLLLGGGVVLLVWGTFLLLESVENHDDDDSINQDAQNGLACMAFGGCAIVSSYPCLVYGLRKDWRTNILMTATYFLLIPGWILITISVVQEQQLSTSSEETYYQPMTMQIVSSRTILQDSIPCNNNGLETTCRGFQGQLELAWTSDDASCSSSASQFLCRVWISDPTCNQYTHHGDAFVNDEVTARDKTTECIKDRYGLIAFDVESIGDPDSELLLLDDDEEGSLEQQPLNETTNNVFNRETERPAGNTTAEIAGTFLTLEAYGSCSADCEAVLSMPSSDGDIVAPKIGPIGFGMSIAGAIIVLLVGLGGCGKEADNQGIDDDGKGSTQRTVGSSALGDEHWREPSYIMATRS